MLELKFPDGSVKQFPKGITGLEVAGKIAMSLEKLGACVKINGKMQRFVKKEEARE